MNKNITSYYNERAKEYDKVYQIAEEQEDLSRAAELFQNIFKDKSVLEIACGTGYWTEKISKTATSIFSTDINSSVIDIAKARNYRDNVIFQVADMHDLNSKNKFDGLFAGFIWSHILVQDIDGFLAKMKELITNDGEMVFIDSRPVEGTKHDKRRITRIDEWGNTFQTRELENGTLHEVLKNFPDKEFLIDKLSIIASDVKIIELEHYWIATGKQKNEKLL